MFLGQNEKLIRWTLSKFERDWF